KLWIFLRFYCRGINDKFCIVGNMLSFVADKNFCSKLSEFARLIRFVKIASGNRDAPFKQNLCKSAHSGASDADEMHSGHYAWLLLRWERTESRSPAHFLTAV